ncbi:MAG: hypothetical protein ACR2HN_03925 [Tepidiformaceae bacterium]
MPRNEFLGKLSRFFRRSAATLDPKEADVRDVRPVEGAATPGAAGPDEPAPSIDEDGASERP